MVYSVFSRLSLLCFGSTGLTDFNWGTSSPNSAFTEQYPFMYDNNFVMYGRTSVLYGRISRLYDQTVELYGTKMCMYACLISLYGCIHSFTGRIARLSYRICLLYGRHIALYGRTNPDTGCISTFYGCTRVPYGHLIPFDDRIIANHKQIYQGKTETNLFVDWFLCRHYPWICPFPEKASFYFQVQACMATRRKGASLLSEFVRFQSKYQLR